MSNPSNLYAEKIYSEHPLVLWALDDKLDYKSLITEAQRNLATLWTPTSAALASSAQDLSKPFVDSHLTRVRVNVPVSETLEASIISPNILNFNTLADLGSFTFGSYFYSNSDYLTSVSIGYEYTDPATSSLVQNFKKFTTVPNQEWFFISETFEKPQVSAQLRLIFKIEIFEGSVTSADNEFYINGITLGQWNEEFNATSLGISTTFTPSDIVEPYNNFEAVEAQAYGISEDSGYYLVDNNNLLCKNSGIPLVYGASGTTKINQSDGFSLIIPGKGFLNQRGQHAEYTVEFWTRIIYNGVQPFKIFGPILSDNGLYVENGFLTLVVGDQFASHFVGEWFRPMLIHIRIIKDNASLLVNGEEVLSLNFDTNSLVLPSEFDVNGKNQDWVGFAAGSNIPVFEIDCFAIYSYQVSTILAKRRWVYGQGVAPAETISSVYSGTNAFIDYSFADYTANYNYPDFAKWSQGVFDNLNATGKYLKTPEYYLPEIFLETKTLQELYDDNDEIQDNESGPGGEYKFLSLKPNNSWNNINSYFNFSNFSFLTNQINSFYGIFSSHDLLSTEVLFKIYNPITGDFLSIIKNEDVVEYSLTYNGDTVILFTSELISLNEFFTVGFNLPKLINNFGDKISSFFGNENELRMYAFGDESGLYNFTGKIWSVGFSTEKNSKNIIENFNSEGFIIFDNAEVLINHTASYTLLPSKAYNKYYLDIGISGYWQDYLPLSYFAQFVKDSNGNNFYELDFLQFNIDYPEIINSSIDSEYNSYYDTAKSEVKSYLTFQYLIDGANTPTTFDNEELPNQTGVLDINNYTDWENTKFEVLNNTLIYPTKEVDFNSLAIVYSLEFNTRRSLSRPISINRLQLTSQALNDNSFNPIGTKFGENLFPYKKSGIYYDYKSKNPFSIYKQSTPYLYLTKTSGIEIRGDFNFLENRGISLPINKEISSTCKINGVQLWLKNSQEFFSSSATELFEINYEEGQIKFYIQANTSSGDRGKIFAKNQDGDNVSGLVFYVNGILVGEPVISLYEWLSLGIYFGTSLNFTSYLGNLNVTGPAVFNNISYYRENSLSFSGLDLSKTYKSYTGTNKIIADHPGHLSFVENKIRYHGQVLVYPLTLFPV